MLVFVFVFVLEISNKLLLLANSLAELTFTNSKSLIILLLMTNNEFSSKYSIGNLKASIYFSD